MRINRYTLLLLLFCTAVPLRAAATPAPPSPAPPLTLSFVGDLMLGTRAGARGPGAALAEVRTLLRADDLTVGNFECAATGGGVAAQKQYVFRTDPKRLHELKSSGVEAITLANNHSLDYGPAALLETLRAARGAGLVVAGAGATGAEAMSAQRIATRRGTVVLLAASRVLPHHTWAAGKARPGVAGAYQPEWLVTAVRRARAGATLVVVYLHWGTERAPYPDPWQRALGRRLIDAGADLVIGAHPHVLQGLEWHKGKLIAYSLGNFISSSRARGSGILQVTLTGQTLSAALLPCWIGAGRTKPLPTGMQRRAILRELERRSYGVRVTTAGGIEPREGAGSEGTGGRPAD
jgi:poly-gamma-glutamate capsule biosynthesis protein CapA/YwtB (metallophosphatase superfamily)